MRDSQETSGSQEGTAFACLGGGGRGVVFQSESDRQMNAFSGKEVGGISSFGLRVPGRC